MGRPVCFRIFQRHAHLHSPGSCDHGAVQAPVLVRILSYGDHDPGICKIRNGKKEKDYGRTGKEDSGAAEAAG